ncbi:peptide chain release factor N(5)-glutamine methyltransferase [Botrimarina sp.]|uniref:peptide chain release factor N(5)-glutamine methyltransferase n=1 Tax=Botrimarina sp. TaxID=2795802 RepID=UPI0032F01C64
MPDASPWSVLKLLTWTTDFFKSKEVDSPRLDAEVLLAEVLGCKRIELYARFEEVPPAAARDAFKALVKKRGDGEPVAYLVGRKEFYSLDLEVEPGVLIPRPETELLVLTALDRLKARGDAAPMLADVGTGTGAIAIAVAKHAPAAKVVAIDVDPQAVALANKNAERHGLADRVFATESDLFARLKAERRFDLILSNPPYVTTNELMNLDPTVKDHEPHLALDGGPEGTDVIERLLAAAPDRLKEGGELLVEISPMIAARVERLVGEAPGLQHVATIKDLAGHARVVHARLG